MDKPDKLSALADACRKSLAAVRGKIAQLAVSEQGQYEARLNILNPDNPDAKLNTLRKMRQEILDVEKDVDRRFHEPASDSVSNGSTGENSNGREPENGGDQEKLTRDHPSYKEILRLQDRLGWPLAKRFPPRELLAMTTKKGQETVERLNKSLAEKEEREKQELKKAIDAAVTTAKAESATEIEKLQGLLGDSISKAAHERLLSEALLKKRATPPASPIATTTRPAAKKQPTVVRPSVAYDSQAAKQPVMQPGTWFDRNKRFLRDMILIAALTGLVMIAVALINSFGPSGNSTADNPAALKKAVWERLNPDLKGATPPK